MTLSDLLTTLKQVNGVARSSDTGEVIESAGYPYFAAIGLGDLGLE